MVKSLFGKVMWVGRATVFLVGLAIVFAVVLGVTSIAFAANGGNFILGKNNVATAVTKLAGNVGVNGPMLRLDNNNDGAAATALDLRVASGKPPMTVNSDTQVANLNADKLDNKDSTEFLGSSVYTKQSSVQGVANQIKEANLVCNAGDVMLSGGYTFGFGPEILQDTVFNNTYFLAWRSGAQPVNAVLFVTCADQ